MKYRILLAEDDEDDQQFFLNFLQCRNDIDLLPVAENGFELLEQLENNRASELPHFIILDQNMPKKNGLQTLQVLKENSKYSHIPVMIYSTYTDEALIKNGSEMGACIVLPKPFTKDGYEKMMNTLITTCKPDS